MAKSKSFWSHPLAIIGYFNLPAVVFYILMNVPVDTIKDNRGSAVFLLIFGSIISTASFITAGYIARADYLNRIQKILLIILIIVFGLLMQFWFSAVCIFTPILFK
jgi:hypothetical protein